MVGLILGMASVLACHGVYILFILFLESVQPPGAVSLSFFYISSMGMTQLIYVVPMAGITSLFRLRNFALGVVLAAAATMILNLVGWVFLFSGSGHLVP